MLLAIDIGNTNAACGLFRGKRLIAAWKMPTVACSSAPRLVRRLSARIGRRSGKEIDGVCIVSVVPRLNRIFRAACRKMFNASPLFATPRTIGIALRRYSKEQVGCDRLVNALAAYERYARACIVVDIGTAITFDVVNAEGEFEGGAIAPGPELMSEALHRMTARLPKVFPARPKRAIGRSTKEGICSGVVLGCAGAIDRIVDRIVREMKGRPVVVATGGAAPLLVPLSRTVQRADADLTLEGLRIVWERNGGASKNHDCHCERPAGAKQSPSNTRRLLRR